MHYDSERKYYDIFYSYTSHLIHFRTIMRQTQRTQHSEMSKQNGFQQQKAVKESQIDWQ